jgi:hypothetical protein
MDFSFVGTAATAIGVAREFGKAALAVRDFNEMAAIVRQLNDQILKAQDSLFAHNTELLRIQQEQFESAQKIRELQEALNDMREYSLVEIGGGFRAYQRKASAVSEAEVQPTPLDVPQYFCQPCFEGKRIKATLQPNSYMGTPTGLECRVCKERFLFRVES